MLGADYGSTGYTTKDQADLLATHLQLRPGDRLADIGTGNGWPGIYLVESAGCAVVGTDLPYAGMANARERAAFDGHDGRATYAVATGRHQPLRSRVFDAVVHTDVLCCLSPKLAVLRACRRLLRPGGRMAFTTIYVPDDLEPQSTDAAFGRGPGRWRRASPTHSSSPELVSSTSSRSMSATTTTPPRSARGVIRARPMPTHCGS